MLASLLVIKIKKFYLFKLFFIIYRAAERLSRGHRSNRPQTSRESTSGQVYILSVYKNILWASPNFDKKFLLEQSIKKIGNANLITIN